MLTERLEQGEIDIAIMASPDGFPETLEATPLYREQFHGRLSGRPSLFRSLMRSADGGGRWRKLSRSRQLRIYA